ncbi:unnamed protein product, partial [Mesorhabditis belari]|uniref:Uncharacterized protein n=1 Tax=Mesorhabditis belari TaxID=2138241 RepID=A0AAF3E8E5_9BILA
MVVESYDSSQQKIPLLIGGREHLIRMGHTLIEKPGGFERFCGYAHVRTLSIWIALLEVIYLIYQGFIVSTDILTPSSNVSSISSSLHAFAVILALTAVFLHVLGILRRTPTLLIPHMLMQVLAILALFALAAFSLYALLVGTSVKINLTIEGDLTTEGLQAPSNFPRLPLPRVPIAKVSALLIAILITVTIFYATTAMATIWCFHVVLDCYRWLILRIAEKAQVNGNRPPTIPVIVEATKGGQNGANGHQNHHGVVPSQV